MLSQGNEQVRRNETKTRMFPAQQRLHRVHTAAGCGDLGLEVQHQGVGLDRLAQVADQHKPLGTVSIAFEAVDRVAAALLLCDIHRHLSTSQQGHRILAVLRSDGDSDTGAHVDGATLDNERLLACVQQHVTHDACLVHVGRLQQDRKLVTAEPRDRVRLLCVSR